MKNKASAWLILMGLSLLFLEIIAFRLRMIGFFKNFSQDEYCHFIVSLTSKNLLYFINKIGPNMQPLLDFTILRFIWIPIFGSREVLLRLWPLCVSMSTVGCVFWITFRYFQKSESSKILSWAFAFAIGLWAATHTTEISDSNFIRPYPLAALISALWWANYILFPTELFTKRFFLLSLFFMNSLFFAFAVVAGAFGLEFLGNWKKNKYKLLSRDSIKCIAAPGLLLLITAIMNFSGIRWLLFLTPMPSEHKINLAALQSAYTLWISYFRYADWPMSSKLIILLSLAIPYFAKFKIENSRKRILFMFLVIQPIFYILIRLKSDYPFGERHQSFFYGLSFVTLVLAIDSLRHLITKLPSYTHYFIAIAFCISPLAKAYTLLPAGNSELISRIQKLNFSENFREQEYAQKLKLPILWMHDVCYESDNPLYYLANNSIIQADPQGYSRNAYPYGFLVVNSLGCEHIPEQSNQEISHFYQIHKESTLVIHLQDQSPCPENIAANPIPGVQLLRMPKTVTPKCSWVASGVKDIETVQKIATLLNLKFAAALFNKK